MSMPSALSAMPAGALSSGIPVGLSTTQPVDDRQMSALPVIDQPWPPAEYAPVSHQHRVWDAWWCGDRQKLAWVLPGLLQSWR